MINMNSQEDEDFCLFPAACYSTKVILKDAGKGYRFLKVGETPIKGDEIQKPTGKWVKIKGIDLTLGAIESTELPMRRKL